MELSMEIGLVKPPEEILNVIASTPDAISSIPLVLLSMMMVVCIGLMIKKPQKLSVLVMLIASISTSFVMPVSATVYNYGSPLSTSDIGLFAYYDKGVSITLADTVTGWQEYTDYGSYYDGIVRVRMNTSGTTFTDSGSYYVDIPVRVRNDGWIMAWIVEATSEKYIPFFTSVPEYGIASGATVSFSDYQTTLARAMYRILYVANIVGTYTYDDVGYYDYELPTATKFIMIHAYDSTSPNPMYRHMYFAIPSGTVLKSHTMCNNYSSNGVNLALYFDSTQLYTTQARNMYVGYDTTSSCTTAVTHDVYTTDTYASGSSSRYMQIVQMIWM